MVDKVIGLVTTAMIASMVSNALKNDRNTVGVSNSLFTGLNNLVKNAGGG